MQSGDFEAAGLGVDQRYGGKVGFFFRDFIAICESSFFEKYLGGQVFGFKATFRFSWFLFCLLALKDWKEEMIQFHHFFLWLASHKKQLEEILCFWGSLILQIGPCLCIIVSIPMFCLLYFPLCGNRFVIEIPLIHTLFTIVNHWKRI